MWTSRARSTSWCSVPRLRTMRSLETLDTLKRDRFGWRRGLGRLSAGWRCILHCVLFGRWFLDIEELQTHHIQHSRHVPTVSPHQHPRYWRNRDSSLRKCEIALSCTWWTLDVKVEGLLCRAEQFRRCFPQYARTCMPGYQRCHLRLNAPVQGLRTISIDA